MASKLGARIRSATFLITLWVGASPLTLKAQSEASDALVGSIFHNAWLAARDDAYTEVLQHWYLFQSLAIDRQAYAAPFASLLWATVDHLDLCPENLELDRAGAELWPLVLHNYLIRHRKDSDRPPQLKPEGVEAFQSGFQRRRVALTTTLEAPEMLALEVQRFPCSAVAQSRDLDDRALKEPAAKSGSRVKVVKEERARLLLAFLRQARLHWQEGDAARLLDLRIFSIQLYLEEKGQADAALVEQAAALADAELDADTIAFIPQLIAESDLPLARRRTLLLEWLDRAIARQDAAGTRRIIGLIDRLDPDARVLIWSGVRGERLVAWGENFPEGSALALHQALDYYGQRQILPTLRSLAESTRLGAADDASAVLAMKWIKFILLQYRFEGRLLDFLRQYLKPATFKAMAQDLMWTSVFYRERYFIEQTQTRDLLGYRLRSMQDKLSLIAAGRDGQVIKALEKDEPRQALQFIRSFTEQLSGQSQPLIVRMEFLLRGMQKVVDRQVGHSALQQDVRLALDALLIRAGALSEQQKDRQVAAGASVMLGTVAVEPSGAAPWPFPDPERVGLNVFRAIHLRAEAPGRASARSAEYVWKLSEK